ncbi:hypothetical protein UPM517_1968 [Salmonella enterica subsp. enterica serovar Stanley]|nr:hypothetical protein UPM517_1968 [Salmonella enterica subsp. enterica serovar Stanley]
MYVYPGFFLPVRAQASAKRIVSSHLLVFCFTDKQIDVNQQVCIRSFLKKM